MWKALLVASTFASTSATALAQAGDPLPQKLSGHMTAAGATQTFILNVAMEFDGERKPGTITGRVTHQGVNCGAQDEPLSGTWDGSELHLAAALHANVHTLRMGGQCDGVSVTYSLEREPGGSVFEGEVRANTTSTVVPIVLSP
jgi:hypothetical protein